MAPRIRCNHVLNIYSLFLIYSCKDASKKLASKNITTEGVKVFWRNLYIYLLKKGLVFP